VSAPRTFRGGSRRLGRAKVAMALLDMVTVPWCLGVAVAHRRALGSAPAAGIAALAVGMFVWHQLENVALPRRLRVVGAPLYPAGRLWPHLAFTATLVAGAAEWCAAIAAGEGGRPALAAEAPAGLGVLAFALGAAMRVWAFAARGAAAFADPAEAGPPRAAGPFVLSRYPAEAGALAISIGAALALGSSWAVVAAVAFGAPASAYAAWREARAWSGKTESAGRGVTSLDLRP
jgi:protein-S-isoprenylcysteine O-methyltransferase Ste14